MPGSRTSVQSAKWLAITFIPPKKAEGNLFTFTIKNFRIFEVLISRFIACRLYAQILINQRLENSSYYIIKELSRLSSLSKLIIKILNCLSYTIPTIQS